VERGLEQQEWWLGSGVHVCINTAPCVVCTLVAVGWRLVGWRPPLFGDNFDSRGRALRRALGNKRAVEDERCNKQVTRDLHRPRLTPRPAEQRLRSMTAAAGHVAQP
jgi:hypothetical protein